MIYRKHLDKSVKYKLNIRKNTFESVISDTLNLDVKNIALISVFFVHCFEQIVPAQRQEIILIL